MADGANRKRKLSVDEVFTRSKEKRNSFDWKTCCFICGERVHEKKKGNVSLVQSGVNSNGLMYTKMLQAAKKRNDNEMIARIIGTNGDLVASDARYHRQKSCYAKYVKVLEQSESLVTESTHPEIMIALKDQFFDDIENQGKVLELSTLKKAYIQLVSDTHKNTETIDNRLFQSILEKEWPTIRVVKRGQGKTPLICSCNISLSEAVNSVYELNSSLNETLSNLKEDDDSLDNNFEDDEESVILHKAAGILRRKMASVKKLDREYYSVKEISPVGQKEFVDKNLMQFLGWLGDKKAYTNGTMTEANQRLVALCSDVIFYATGVVTPKHLGLGISIHHSYGSRKLIDDLYRLGYTISYTELRSFLTAAALHMSDKQQKTLSGALVPSNVKPYEDGCPLLIAAGDNWDHNEATPDGKNTTHAMTSIIVVPSSRRSEDDGRIAKLHTRSLSSEQILGTGGLSAVLHYEKPASRPQPVLLPLPRSTDEIELAETQTSKLLKLKDLTYNCLKLKMFCDDRYEGTWSVYHSFSMNDVLTEKSDIVFNPIMLAQPTHYDTIFTTLKRCKEQLEALGQDHCPIVFDMGLLTKAVEITWAKSNELSGVIPLDGGMHFLMCIFAGIGYIYGDIGLKSLLSESDVFAPKTADQILAGKDFDRGIKAFLMIDEVLTSRFLINFRLWCLRNGHDIFKSRWLSGDARQATDFLNDVVLPLSEEFRAEGREISPTFAFWDDYLQNVSSAFKLYLNASRHALFDVYEYSRSLFLPFFFAANRTVYARYMPYLVLHMQRLPAVVRQSFNSGYFMTKLTQGKFNAVWVDYCLEATENKTLKSNGGIIGLTHCDGALSRWFLSRPVAAKYATAFREADDGDQTRPHHSDNKSSKQFYNDGIMKMTALFEQTFIDPFSLTDPPRELVNITTGVSLPAENAEFFINCHVKGKASLHKFVTERLVVPKDKNAPAKNFFDPLSRFTGVKPVAKQKVVSSNGVSINGEEMYIRLLAMNSFKKVPLLRVLSFENAPVPLSIFTDEGDMMSGKKSDFLHLLEAIVVEEVSSEIASGYCMIFDGMAIIQMTPPVSPNCLYKDMAMSFWKHVLYKGKNASVIHVVFDRYFGLSAKSQTRKRRGEKSSTERSYKIYTDMKIPDWKRCLSEPSFKTEITRFYTLYLAEFCLELLSNDMTVVVSGGLGSRVLRISHEAVHFVPELSTEQEEADSIMILHAKYAVTNGVETVCVSSPDTDVLVLLIHHYTSIQARHVYFLTGRKSTHTHTVRFIPVHSIVSTLPDDQIDIILSVYCVTGCDTTSFFFGIGKKSVFKILSKNASLLSGLSTLGNTPDLTRDHITACTMLVGALYGNPSCKSLNKLRTEKVLRNKLVKPRRLPPTDDSFLLHLQRCLRQLLIWKHALVPYYSQPPFINYGYITDNITGNVKPRMMTQAAAAPELLSDVVCECKDMCDALCPCTPLEQPCTVACGCEATTEGKTCCRNIYTILSLAE